MHTQATATSLAAAVTIALLAPASATGAGIPTCFGRRATIVGTNRDPLREVELRGTPGDDVIVGRGGSDRVFAGGGDDLVCSGGGDDYVVAGPGHDRVRAQKHSDTVYGGPGDDRLWGGSGGADGLLGGPGDDVLFGGRGHEDSLLGGAGNDVLNGGPGYDRAEFWDSPRGVEADLTAGAATGWGDDELVSIEGLVGSRHDDLLVGSELSNDLQGGTGDDVIRALGSAGDGGIDILRSSGGDNVLDGGDGPDIASYNLNPWPVDVDLVRGTTTTDGFGSDSLVGIEHVTGSKENDTIRGDGGDNVIIGNGGDDALDGRGGVDLASFVEARLGVVVDLAQGTAAADWWGSDTLAGFEHVAGSAWQDELTGDDGPNVIRGGSRADVLSGADGDDTLLGDGGTDAANGGAGDDVCDAETEVDCEADPSGSSAVAALPHFVASAQDGEPGECVPAGPRIAFVRDLGPLVGNEIFTIRPNGRGTKRLTDNAVDEWGPSWSPDGTRIAFSSTRDGNSEIYTMARDGSDVVRLTHHDASDGAPAWSPDGSKIAFSSGRDDPENVLSELFVMDADGGNVVKIVGGDGPNQNVSWSPNGRRIAFDRGDEIFTARSDGTGLKRLTRRKRMLANNPAWSHDGKRIAFHAQTSEANGSDLWVMRRDGSRKRAVVVGGHEEQSATWSPNDRFLAFTTRWRVARVRADGKRLAVLVDHDLADYALDWGRAVRC